MVEIALVGNPNCGKTTLFNLLTGAKQRVGNWSGVTVERKSGSLLHCGQQLEIVDLPGTYSLSLEQQGALDERIACEYILSESPCLVVNVLDATHLERSLYLTLQLLEMGAPLILAVNMLDVAQQKDLKIQLDLLSERFACPVVGLQAANGQGITELKNTITETLANPPVACFFPHYPAIVEEAIEILQPQLKQAFPQAVNQCRWRALQLLESGECTAQIIADNLLQVVKENCERIEQTLEEDCDIVVADTRYRFIQERLTGVLRQGEQVTRRYSDYFDRFVLNRFLGIPIFLLVMYSMFLFAINIGTALQDFFQIASDTIFVDGLSVVLQKAHTPNWFIAIVAAGAGTGISTTLTFIPVIGGMFLFLSFLEGSGYMARAAFVVDRLMRAIGLPGKSFVPMIVGFGCNVPSVMASRTLENPRDRVLTIMMSPFMSCGARLAIYAVFIAAFFPTGGQNVIFSLYLIGISMAVLTGLFLRKTLLAGDMSPLIMTLPPYHMPSFKVLMLTTWHRLRSFLVRAGKVIIPLCILVGFLNALTLDGHLSLADGNADSLLSYLGRLITPIFAPMGITQDNWPATVGLATGMIAKEVVVATLNTLYSQVGHLTQFADGAQGFDFWLGIKQALLSIPQNFAHLAQSLTNPVLASAPETEVTQGVYGQMFQRFDGQIGAFAYLLFILLYFPCVATTAAMLRELNRTWAMFSVVWTTGLAYVVAVVFYQGATFYRHPQTSLFWILFCLTGLLSFIVVIQQYASRQNRRQMIVGVQP